MDFSIHPMDCLTNFDEMPYKGLKPIVFYCSYFQQAERNSKYAADNREIHTFQAYSHLSFWFLFFLSSFPSSFIFDSSF